MPLSEDDHLFSEPTPVVLYPEPEPPARGEASGKSAPPEQEDLSFDERHRLDFEGLLYLGYLTDEFVWMGHKFSIRTITTNEYLEVALLHRKFQSTIGDIRAYTAAIVAACLVTVDGQDLPLPLDRLVKDVSLEYRFRYVTDHWYPWVIDAVYERFQELESKVESVMESMGKASG